jgi:MFS family permease
MIVEAMCTQAHACLTGLGAGTANVPNAVTVGFAILLGARDPALGLLAALPVYASFFQFVAAAVAPRLGGRRGFIMLTTLLARVSWLAMGWIPFALGHGSAALAAFLVFWGISNAGLAMGGNLWMSWMADLCPARIRGRYFSRHALFTTVVGIMAPFLASNVLERSFGGKALGFAIIFTLASVFGMLAWAILRAQPEPGPRERPEPPPIELRWFLAPFGDRSFRPLLLFVLVFGATNGLANPFWASFQLEQLKLPYHYVSGLFVAVQGVSTALALALWGRISDRYGNRVVVSLTLGLLALSPLCYVAACSPRHWWIMLLDASLQGVGWAGYNVAIFNLVLSLTPQTKRELYFAAYVTVLGTAQATTSVLAGSFLAALPTSLALGGLALHPRQQVFLLTAVARVACLVFFVKALGAPRNVRIRAAFERARRFLGLPAPAPDLLPNEA